MEPIDLAALGLVESEIDHRVVAYSEVFGRPIRQDVPRQLGVPTQYLAVLATLRGDLPAAETLAH